MASDPEDDEDEFYGSADTKAAQTKEAAKDDDASSGDEPMDEGADSGDEDDEDSESVRDMPSFRPPFVNLGADEATGPRDHHRQAYTCS